MSVYASLPAIEMFDQQIFLTHRLAVLMLVLGYDYKDVPVPTPGPGELLIKVTHQTVTSSSISSQIGSACLHLW